jgi:hypothetical protein
MLLIPTINYEMLKKQVRNILKRLRLLELFYDVYSWYQNLKPVLPQEINKKDTIYISLYESEADLQTKRCHTKELNRLLNPQKVLVSGCSKGNAVAAFREIGIEAWGFDIFPVEDDNILKKYIKQGSILSIPFSSEDNFDLFLCTDVLEHIYMRDISLMKNEIYRLNTKWMAVIIGQGLSDGHVTLKSLQWWEKQFQGKFGLCPEIKTELWPGVYGLDPQVSPSHFTFWKRV